MNDNQASKKSIAMLANMATIVQKTKSAMDDHFEIRRELNVVVNNYSRGYFTIEDPRYRLAKTSSRSYKKRIRSRRKRKKTYIDLHLSYLFKLNKRQDEVDKYIR